MSKRITDFEVLGAIAAEDGPIFSATLSNNLLGYRRCKKGGTVTIGVNHEVAALLEADSLVGAFYFADRKAFFAKKKAMEDEP